MMDEIVKVFLIQYTCDMIVKPCDRPECSEQIFLKPSRRNNKTGMHFCSIPCLEEFRRQEHAKTAADRPKTMTDALNQGVKFYNTGKPCKRGHCADRYRSGRCVECVGIRFVDNNIAPLEVSKDAKLFRATYQRKVERLSQWEQNRQNHPEYCDLPISVKEAKATGSKTYFSGRPCNNGHIVPRYTNTKCSTCVKDRMKQWSRLQVANENIDYIGMRRAWWQKYNLRKKLSCPKWLTDDQLKDIAAFYLEAVNLSLLEGVKYEVDHIVPLQGKTVCGLHVGWNLQVVSRSENRRKSNSFDSNLQLGIA